MGHLRLRNIPRTVKWDHVVSLVKEGADAPEIAAATLDAAQQGLQSAAQDRALVYSVYLLLQIPLAAHEDDFAEALGRVGIRVSESPDVMELAAAFTRAVDERLYRTGGRTDLGELAQIAATETIVEMPAQEMPTLFGGTPRDARSVFRGVLSGRKIGRLSRLFFSRLTRRFLSSYLSCVLPSHVGTGSRFGSTRDHSDFRRAFDRHCFETSYVVEEFAKDWFWKTHQEEGITPRSTARFVYEAVEKLRKELVLRERGDE